jgi:DNA-binding winged helix-turn-helix (wHTH) protein/Tol biopolymer transport system component
VAVSPAQDVIHFGLFELDLKAGQLTRNGSNLRLPQQPLQLLALLLERPGEILTRDELRQRLWPSDVFVDFDHGLNKSIQKLRDALGDSATSPRYIETIPRVGYRFIAPVRTPVRNESRLDTIPPPTLAPPAELPASATPTVAIRKPRWLTVAAGVSLLAALLGAALYFLARPRPAVLTYTQLTGFTDSATAPALSADGHIVAFIRGDSWFGSPDQIYVKILPSGEPRQLTHDPRLKYGLAFSPDGSQLAYSVIKDQGFSTYIVSVLGGEPHLLLDNAAGLTWLSPDQLLYSRIRSGLHMGIVTQSVAGGDFREIYFPAHERSMAHYSFPSPDRKSALVVEMNQAGWECRLISLSGAAPARSVGLSNWCTAAAWSPNGEWMYFIAGVDHQNHIWRQRFPDGNLEQITFGGSDEIGLAMAPDGRSLISSVGVTESAIWIHDEAGERSLSSEGQVIPEHFTLSFTADNSTLYYLVRGQPATGEPELWRMTVDSGKAEAVFPGISINSYDISADGKQVVYSASSQAGKPQLWLAPVDKSSPPKPIGKGGDTDPHFGPGQQIIFQGTEGNVNYAETMNRDGSGRTKLSPYPVLEVQDVSPGGKWLMAIFSRPEGKRWLPTVMALPLSGGAPLLLCKTYCRTRWASDGKYLYIATDSASQTNPGRTLALAIVEGSEERLPAFPPDGITTTIDAKTIPGSQWVNRGDLVPGKDPSHFAYVKSTEHRNLYRISLPE